ncbi:uncharacterized protein LOC127836947 isoform X4 [Dreissena polymorpha]|uniref:uncharacterized protein LOC127836947 isoform X3 n=1 Tax=Dreissena polymorpha TaxID=45954 RepID=UPI0022645447|nr:uncharacterized protein LOC127836947 isoform X3 [Dreissena polymorpha]XP_052219574.1 uncharacterized protein LOC127836947 isoform X4 [Dreissena polymorpha]
MQLVQRYGIDCKARSAVTEDIAWKYLVSAAYNKRALQHLYGMPLMGRRRLAPKCTMLPQKQGEHVSQPVHQSFYGKQTLVPARHLQCSTSVPDSFHGLQSVFKRLAMLTQMRCWRLTGRSLCFQSGVLCQNVPANRDVVICGVRCAPSACTPPRR